MDRRATVYWVLALVLLPVVNPVLMVAVASVVQADSSGVYALIALAGMNLVVLRLVAEGGWADPVARRWRVFFGAIAVVAISVLCAVIEFFIYLWIVCPAEGCFS